MKMKWLLWFVNKNVRVCVAPTSNAPPIYLLTIHGPIILLEKHIEHSSAWVSAAFGGDGLREHKHMKMEKQQRNSDCWASDDDGDDVVQLFINEIVFKTLNNWTK